MSPKKHRKKHLEYRPFYIRVPLYPSCVCVCVDSALSAYSPAVFALNDMLREQLSLTRHYVQANRSLHSSLLQSLEPADYTYTTLEGTKEVGPHTPD